MAIKTFTTGEVLTASDTNTYLANAGLVYVTEATFTSTPTVTVSNCFTSTYANYRILVYAEGTSNTNALTMTFISGGTERTAGYYGQVMSYDPTAGSTTWYAYNQTTRLPIGWLPNGFSNQGSMSVDIYNPQVSTLKTSTHGTHFGISSGAAFYAGMSGGQYTTAEAQQGFWLRNVAGTNMTGKVFVYGYRSA